MASGSSRYLPLALPAIIKNNHQSPASKAEASSATGCFREVANSERRVWFGISDTKKSCCAPYKLLNFFVF